MILTAHQPVYMPWLGLFHKISLADQYCIFDIAQYQTRDYNNRNQIKTQSGPLWLSVPVESKDHFNKRLCDIKIAGGGWEKKHFKSISLAYRKAPYFERYIYEIEKILTPGRYQFLTDLNRDILVYFLKCLEINVPIVKASDYSFKGSKSDLVLDMCAALKAKTYLFGANGKDYADVGSFHKKGIEVFFQDYQHPVYRQLHGEFTPYLSTLDLLFNEGPESKRILMEGNAKSLKAGLQPLKKGSV